ncbi:selenocysteine-specific translation factor [Steroidobacter agaridevorans]|uniref:Selenocysteine-specific elongation factor n=1 Tax=Steroidobacter agaridevorans TaxID=2695856 RepID=A0A829YBM7_9GAMM|nr:selenocysteine-specific translation elongation factor [Steroidobacter agaridevorans]GFE80545.1 selenocysteine-specific translation factor [Steroidobacter agaridevorans]
MLVATAGHIDHGKTSLIRALTGVATDRLPEERARGISIDLGFAYWQPDAGPTIGFVDVPGHERYVRNMLAGASGIDFALLVVAADDGVMPQTVEHVQILDLLAVARGTVAITKCDRSSPERIVEVRQQVEALLSTTALASAPMFEVSATTGAGVLALGAALCEANRVEHKRLIHERNFRLAIDRAFSVSGAGTVVTGTVRDGALDVGARLLLSPHNLEVRVRGLQSAGQPRTQVHAGERCAINLTGVEVAQIHRGDWLIVPSMHAPTMRLEVRLKLLDVRTLKHNAPVHFHHGTADISARVLLPKQASISPGTEAAIQLALDHPTCAVAGDRFVLRDHSGRLLMGGGTIVDPLAPTERRKQSDRAAVSAALQSIQPAEALAALLAVPGHEVDTVDFERRFNLTPAAARTIYKNADVVLLSPLAVPARRVAAITENIVDSLETFHREHPDARGMSARELKASLTTPISTDAFLALQKELTENHVIATSGSVMKLPGHTVDFSAADDERWRKVQRLVQSRGALLFSPREVTAEAKISEPVVKAMLYRRRSSGDVWRIDDERFMLRDQVAALAARAAVLAREVGSRGFTAAQYRDATGIGRNQVIRILEFFDSIGVTRRDGDRRKVRPDYFLIVGTAPPYRRPLDKPARSTAP